MTVLRGAMYRVNIAPIQARNPGEDQKESES